MFVYGHRGAAGEAPENTLAGFRHAMRQGIRHFEMDLRCAKGGEIVVVHDARLSRTHLSRSSVHHSTSEQLAEQVSKSDRYLWQDSTGIPTLHAVVQQCRGAAHFQFEVKTGQLGDHEVFCERLAGFIREARLKRRCTITSGDPELLRTMRQVDPAVSLGLVAEAPKPNPVKLAVKLGCDTLVLSHELVKHKRVDRAHQAGLLVSCWTVNSLEVVARLFHLGVDSVITDYPTAMLAHVQMMKKLTLRSAQTRSDSHPVPGGTG